MMRNQSLAEQLSDALMEHANCKSAVFKAERLYKRSFARALLTAEGKNAAEKQAAAQINPAVLALEDEWIEAEAAANLARAAADGLEHRFEEYRTNEASARRERYEPRPR